MPFRLPPPFLAPLLLPLLLLGCRDAKITTYRVPREEAPALAQAAAAAPTAAAGELQWTAPSSWIPKPLTQMRKGSFAIQGENGGEADFSIISFPGDVGGLAANVNRWREQIGLPALTPNELGSALQTLEGAAGLRFTLVDFANQAETGATRVLGAILPFGDETYFFKLSGPDPLVAGERGRFLDFLNTVVPR